MINNLKVATKNSLIREIQEIRGQYTGAQEGIRTLNKELHVLRGQYAEVCLVKAEVERKNRCLQKALMALIDLISRGPTEGTLRMPGGAAE